MKKVKILLLFILICFIFSGCSGSLFSSVDDLIAPVAPSGDDAGIISAVDDYCKGGYSVKIPSAGNYTTSIISHDFDADGNDEAIAFYQPKDKFGEVNMALLSKINSQWKVISNVTGEGADVNMVEFSDLNNDGSDEIVVCWSVISKSSTSTLCVYDIDESLNPELIADSITCSDFISVDINEDSVSELLVFNFGGSAVSPRAELYSFVGNDKSLIGETKLDNTIISFSNIICGETDEGMSVYADAIRSDGNSMVTELLYWSDYYDSVISPFYSYSTGKTRDTSRNNLIISRDIDNNGEIEIPVDKSVKGLPKQLSAQNWVGFGKTVLNHRMYSVACKEDCYLLTLDDDLFSKAQFAYDADKRELTVSSDEKELFKIITVIKTAYNSVDYNGYTEIFSDSGFVYLAKISSTDDFSLDELKKAVRRY